MEIAPLSVYGVVRKLLPEATILDPEEQEAVRPARVVIDRVRHTVSGEADVPERRHATAQHDATVEQPFRSGRTGGLGFVPNADHRISQRGRRPPGCVAL